MRRLLILLLLAGPALAQPSPEALEAGRALVEAAGARGQVEAALIGMRGQIVAGIRRNNPGLTDAAVGEIVDEFMMPEFRARAPELLEFAARTWAERMSVEELRQVAAIFSTPIGRRLIEVQPQIAVQGARFGQEWGQRVAAAAFAKHRETLRARGLTL